MLCCLALTTLAHVLSPQKRWNCKRSHSTWPYWKQLYIWNSEYVATSHWKDHKITPLMFLYPKTLESLSQSFINKFYSSHSCLHLHPKRDTCWVTVAMTNFWLYIDVYMSLGPLISSQAHSTLHCTVSSQTGPQLIIRSTRYRLIEVNLNCIASHYNPFVLSLHKRHISMRTGLRCTSSGTFYPSRHLTCNFSQLSYFQTLYFFRWTTYRATYRLEFSSKI